MSEQISNLQPADPESDYAQELSAREKELASLGNDDSNLARRKELLEQILELQNRQKAENQEKEKYWTYEMFVDWARDEVATERHEKYANSSFGLSKEHPEQWIDFTFDLSNINSPKVKIPILNLTQTPAKRIPPHLYAQKVLLKDSSIEEIPQGSKFVKLFMPGCRLEFVSSDVIISHLTLTRELQEKKIIKKIENLKKEGKISEIVWK
ncbi:hypothetical protein HN958_03505 [Candidatus Falkowbacteria bacterium]|jgi:hypothetical protein|nr:hypothetical protein [Candidatus Falkowbacteria bacterium]MBT7007544.1 hypothetical protein [Candidatus Falkowbacteria bacterium]